MLKLLRKYQKWMLVVFCSGLMVAFVVPQALQQFAPSPGKQTMGTLPDGDSITVNDRRAAQFDLELLSSVGSGNAFGIALQFVIPQAEEETDRALGWLLMLEAAKQQGLTASTNEAFTLLSTMIEGLDDADDLERIATQRNTTTQHMIRVARDFLIAEQYRQLITGIEYASGEGQNVSPGLDRVQRFYNAELDRQNQTKVMQVFMDLQTLIPPGTDMSSFQRIQQIAQILSFQAMNFDALGQPRISAPLLRNAVQEQFSTIAGEAVVLDSESYKEGLTADPDRMATLFEKYKNFPAGAGEPMGFGYRVPDRVMVEAIRVPSEQVRKLAELEVTDAEVGAQLRQNMAIYRTWQPASEEEESTEPDQDQPETESETQSDSEAEAGDATGEDAGEAEAPADAADGPDPNQGTPPQSETPADQGDADASPKETVGDDAEEGLDAPATDDDNTPPSDEPIDKPLTTIDNDPAKLILLRAEIRRSLVEQKTRELTARIARTVREEMDKQVRSFPESGGYRELPSDFKPVSLEEIAKTVSDRFSTDQVTLELQVIPADNRWVHAQVIGEAIDRVFTRVADLERESILFVNPQSGELVNMEVVVQPLLPITETDEQSSDDPSTSEDAEQTEPTEPPTLWDTILSSQTVRTYGQNQRGQPSGLSFDQYLSTTKSLRPARSTLPRTGLQRGVPSEVMIDPTRSNIVFRITRVDPAHAPKSMQVVEEQLREDAITAQAYDLLLETKERLLESATQSGLAAVVPEGEEVQTVPNFSRISPPRIEGVTNAEPIVQAIIDKVEKLREQGKISDASDADRTLAIELPRQQKLVIFKLTDFTTLSQNRLKSESGKDWITSLAYAQAVPQDDGRAALITLEDIIAITGFKYNENYQSMNNEPSAEGGEEEE